MSMFTFSGLLQKAMLASLVFLTSFSTTVVCMDSAPLQTGVEFSNQLDALLEEQKYGEIFKLTTPSMFNFNQPTFAADLWLTNRAVEECDGPLLYDLVCKKASAIKADDLETQKEHLALIMVSLALAKADSDCCKALAHVSQDAVQPYDIFKKHYAYYAASFCKNIEYAKALECAKSFFASIDLEKLPLAVWVTGVVDTSSYASFKVAFNTPSSDLRNVYKDSLIASKVRQARETSLAQTWKCFSSVKNWQDFFKLSAADLNSVQDNSKQADAMDSLSASVLQVAQEVMPESESRFSWFWNLFNRGGDNVDGLADNIAQISMDAADDVVFGPENNPNAANLDAAAHQASSNLEPIYEVPLVLNVALIEDQADVLNREQGPVFEPRDEQ